MAFLIQVNDGVKSVVLPLGRAVILVGRDSDSNLYLDDSGISKNHASIVFSNETYTLKDNGSSSGSLVNGVRVREHKLAHDEIIQFGPYLFKVDLKNPIPATTSTAAKDVQLERSGHSYTRRVQLEEIAGLEKAGSLHVVMTDTPKTLPPPLPTTGFLANLSVQERQDLSLRGVYRYARTGEVLIKEGQNSGRLFLLISGKWQARKEETKAVLGHIQPGEWVGEVNIFDPSGAMCSVVAVDSSEYWEITREAFEKFINEARSTGSAILIALAATLGRRIRQSAEGLEQARSTRPDPLPARRSGAAPVFAGIAVLAILVAAAFFLKGAADKNRLQAEKQQLVLDRAEASEEARQQVESLQASLAKTREDFKESLADKENLAQRLDAALKEIETINQAKRVSEKSEANPPEPTETPEEQAAPNARSGISAKAAPLAGYPSKIAITQKTNVSLTVDGRISGNVVLPEGRELTVVGVEGSFVIVEFGDAHQKIPKAHTNFTEALLAEAKAAQSKSAATPPEARTVANGSMAQAPPLKTTASSKSPVDSKDKPAELTLAEVTSVLEAVKLLETLGDLRNMRTATEPEVARFMSSLGSKWKRASKESGNLISLSGGRDEYRAILRKVIEASEMLEPSRLQMFEAKLREIDKSWLDLETEKKIQILTESPNTPGPGR